MLSYMPTLLLPPLVPPPSISSRINGLLDSTQNLFKQHKFEQARDTLFTAYALFETEDALMDYYKSYFHTMNGLLLLKMLEFQDYNPDRVQPSHIAKLAITAFTDSIDVSQKLTTCDRAFPRFFLGFLFFKLKRYETSLRFFRQAEALAISAEGAQSVFSLMAEFDIAVVGFKMLVNKVFASCAIDRFDQEKQNLSLVQQEEEGAEYGLELVDSEDISQIEKIGQFGLEKLENLIETEENELPEAALTHRDEDTAPRSQQSFLVLCDEFVRLEKALEESVGTAHFYAGEAAAATFVCREYAQTISPYLNQEAEKQMDILEEIHSQGDHVQRALAEFGAKFKKIPPRALYVPVKRAKKSKK